MDIYELDPLVLPLDIIRICVQYMDEQEIRFYEEIDWEPNDRAIFIHIDGNVAEWKSDHTQQDRVYSQLAVSEGIHEWRLRMERVEHSEGLYVGIVGGTDARHKILEYLFGPNAVGEDGVSRNNGKVAKVFIMDNEWMTQGWTKVSDSFQWKSGDVVTVILDLNRGELQFRRRWRVLTSISIGTHKKKMEYRLVVCCHHKGNKVRLLSHKLKQKR